MAVIRLFFSREVMDEAATSTPANYAVSGGVTVSAASRISGKVVELTTSELATGTTYTVTVSNIRDRNGRPISSEHTVASFVGAFGVGPRLLSATSLNATTVRLIFNEAMNQTDLETEGNYAFAGPAAITAGTATYVNATTVDITISGEMLTGTANYTVTVSGADRKSVV